MRPWVVGIIVLVAIAVVAGLIAFIVSDHGSDTQDPPQPGRYPRERQELTPVELETYGGLLKGDCVNNPSDDFTTGVTAVDCSLPHTDQVMGYVDLSEGMPDISDAVGFEIATVRRCNSVKEAIPVPEAFDMGVKVNVPGEEEWDAGVRVALCWVPVSDITWVGSVLDGSAREY